MLRMNGTTVQICRYKVDWVMRDAPYTSYAYTKEEADAVAQKNSGTVAEIDTSSEDWMNGLTFADRDEAMTWLEKGKAAYELEQQILNTQTNAQLRADMDFLSIMTGVSL